MIEKNKEGRRKVQGLWVLCKGDLLFHILAPALSLDCEVRSIWGFFWARVSKSNISSHFHLNNGRLPRGVGTLLPTHSFPLVPTDSLVGIWDDLTDKP